MAFCRPWVPADKDMGSAFNVFLDQTFALSQQSQSMMIAATALGAVLMSNAQAQFKQVATGVELRLGEMAIMFHTPTVTKIGLIGNDKCSIRIKVSGEPKIDDTQFFILSAALSCKFKVQIGRTKTDNALAPSTYCALDAGNIVQLTPYVQLLDAKGTKPGLANAELQAKYQTTYLVGMGYETWTLFRKFGAGSVFFGSSVVSRHVNIRINVIAMSIPKLNVVAKFVKIDASTGNFEAEDKVFEVRVANAPAIVTLDVSPADGYGLIGIEVPSIPDQDVVSWQVTCSDWIQQMPLPCAWVRAAAGLSMRVVTEQVLIRSKTYVENV